LHAEPLAEAGGSSTQAIRLDTSAAPLLPPLQGQEAWRATEMSAAVDTFHACFLDALQADVKAGLAEKARVAAAEPTLAW
jgi:hypothetical protein